MQFKLPHKCENDDRIIINNFVLRFRTNGRNRGMFISKLIITIFRSFIVKLAIPGILLLMLVNHQIGTVLHNG